MLLIYWNEYGNTLLITGFLILNLKSMSWKWPKESEDVKTSDWHLPSIDGEQWTKTHIRSCFMDVRRVEKVHL